MEKTGCVVFELIARFEVLGLPQFRANDQYD